ncbi:B12-binding domain-containing radical SAM protein [Kibdelosporangium aridum]|uniref:Radical SAM superfamily enzyme YgiQ, UPF0313 family n=1 Tax=Kibdelosporangium aridum TaxID=2030 RepID=A0A1W2FZN7_KIBAR|nr:radical SAM protein [Kibdelosporangium aridum]SMD27429.1 Radical SAM superfamily enzyme YgiQ, UPF0313 family [Kibdelosporangium aridum]
MRASFDSVPLWSPNEIRDVVAAELDDEHKVVVTGTQDRRLVFIESSLSAPWVVVDLSGRPLASFEWPKWTRGRIILRSSCDWWASATITDDGLDRLMNPRLLLVSLYHPEYFPLPRFPLAISDLARAARRTLVGTVKLMDMQLGATLDDIIERLHAGDVDILGVSITFGQHDLATRLLDEVDTMTTPPWIVAGGSLTARNEQVLLDRYPTLIISRGAGESTIADLLEHWHGDIPIENVRGVAFLTDNGRVRRTATVANRRQIDIWPELDLLDATLQHNGVAQLETTRGCTNYCSFCPRSHKGQWAAAHPDGLPALLGDMSAIMGRHPSTSKTMYLVDEEFIGHGPEAVSRALRVADTLASKGFWWETSCRVDQVVRLDRDRDWHVERGLMWRALVARGLRRCLFGIESGVDSVLKRFNKETTGQQNALAIRTLTALGVPPRFTYITFDHLMNETELHETFAFQGRTDLLLRPLPGLAVEEVVDGIHDDQFVAEHSLGEPFYSAVSYMLVGMECLVGAAYTHKAKAAGLTGEINPLMGRVEARYADWRIGVLARHGQLWIDRNFALDYALKSIEKILSDGPYQAVRTVRRILKSAAYRLFGEMLDALRRTEIHDTDHDELDEACRAIADTLIAGLSVDLDTAITAAASSLSDEHRNLVRREHHRWSSTTGWRLINAADPCGT